MRSKPAFVIALGALACGLILQVYQLVFLSSGPVNLFLIGLLLLSIAPYLICGAALFRLHYDWPAAVAGCLVLAADLAMHYSVFIKPAGSTAAVGLLFMPVVNLVLILPIGLLIGWLIARYQKTNAL